MWYSTGGPPYGCLKLPIRREEIGIQFSLSRSGRTVAVKTAHHKCASQQHNGETEGMPATRIFPLLHSVILIFVHYGYTVTGDTYKASKAFPFSQKKLNRYSCFFF